MTKIKRFDSGWRPWLGWVGFAIAVEQGIVVPIANIVLAVLGYEHGAPYMPIEQLSALMLLTGVAVAARSFDKQAGTARDSFNTKEQ